MRRRSFHEMLGWFSPAIFLGPAQLRLGRRGVPVFAYHKISQPPAGTIDPFLFVAPGRFAGQLAALRAANFASASLTEIITARDNNASKVVLTFDDGCADVLQNAIEPMARHGFRAIQFLVAARLGGRNEWDIAKGDTPAALMDDAQIRDWRAAGHEIGSHTMTHRNLRGLSEAEAREEIFASKKLLEDRFGAAIEHFSYPYGGWTDASRDLVGEAGYRTACTMAFGVNTAATPRLELRRIFPLSSGELAAKAKHRLARRLRL